VILAPTWVGHGLGGFQGSYFFDLTESYTMGFATAAIAGLLNLLVVGALLLTVRRRVMRVA